MRPPNQARPSRTSEVTAFGSGNSRRSTPKSGRIVLLPDPKWGELDQVDRDDIAGLSAAHDDRPSYRREGVSITSWREGRWYRADVLDIVKSATYLDRKLFA